MKNVTKLALAALGCWFAALPIAAQPPGASGDSVLKFDHRNFQVREDIGEAVISVERFKGSEGEVSVSYAVVGGTATAGVDYEEVSGTLTWGDGDTGRQTFTVPIFDDADFEVRETIELALEDPQGATLHPGHGRATILLLDVPADNPGHVGDLDDSPGTLSFHRADYQGIEGDGAVTVTVVREGGRAGAVSVDFATADGSATAGADYTAAAGTLSWADGVMGPRTFTVDLLPDDAEEGNETVLLGLAGATGGAEIGEGGQAVLTILDDDAVEGACAPDGETLCLADGRFQVEVDWRTPAGDSGAGQVEPVSDTSGLVWFFTEDNKEILVKVIDACGPPFETFWVFYAATTNVDFTLTVVDTATGVTKEYNNPAGTAAAPVQDTFSFTTCDG